MIGNGWMLNQRRVRESGESGAGAAQEGHSDLPARHRYRSICTQLFLLLAVVLIPCVSLQDYAMICLLDSYEVLCFHHDANFRIK